MKGTTTMTATAQAAPSRAEINRCNAQMSTGPRTASGKQRVKFNALKHGLRAKTIILPGEEGAFNARLDAWIIDLDPRDEVERFMVTRAVEISWKLDRVRRVMESRREALRHCDAERLASQAEEVVALGRRLYWDRVGPLCLYPHAAPAAGEVQHVSYSGDPEDPDDPARIVVRLEAMTLGLAWLLDRWGELRDILEDGLLWQPPDRLKAVRMLGRQPLEATDDRRVMAIYLYCWAMDPADQYGFTDVYNELTPKDRTVYLDRLNAREPMRDLPASPEAARAELLALIAQEEERLEAALAGHLEREEAEAQAALAFDDSAWGERLRKYEVSNDKTLLRIIETLRRRQREADGIGSPRERGSVRAASPSGDLGPIPSGGDTPAEGSGDLRSDVGAAALGVSADPSPDDPGRLAESEFPVAERLDADDSIELTEEVIRARVARLAEVLGLAPDSPAGDVKVEAPSEQPLGAGLTDSPRGPTERLANGNRPRPRRPPIRPRGI